MYIKSDIQMYAHKKARRDTENAPGLETQNVVPLFGTIKYQQERQRVRHHYSHVLHPRSRRPHNRRKPCRQLLP